MLCYRWGMYIFSVDVPVSNFPIIISTFIVEIKQIKIVSMRNSKPSAESYTKPSLNNWTFKNNPYLISGKWNIQLRRIY